MNEVFIFNIVFRQPLSFVMILVGIKEAIISPSDDITEWDRRVLAFRADEASVDLGKKGGVAVLMRKDIPDHVVFHCLPHRLELALLEMQKSCKSVKEVCDVLNLVWKTHHYSVKSSRDLKALASELNKEALKTNSSTWGTMVARRQPRVESVYQVGRCINIRRTNLSLVLCHMEHSSTSSSSTEIKGHEKSISKKMRNV